MAEPRFTPLGKLLSIVLIGGLIALGVYLTSTSDQPPHPTRRPKARGVTRIASCSPKRRRRWRRP